jgi:hypothetical protein
MLKDKGYGLHQWNQGTWGKGVQNIIRDNIDMRESLVGGYPHQFIPAHPDLAARIASPPTERTDNILEKNLGVPKIRFEEEKLTTRLQQTAKGGEIVSVLVMAKDGRANHIIEALCRQISHEIGNPHKLYVWKLLLRRVLKKVVVEYGSSDRILATKHCGKVFCPKATPGANLENRLTWKHMEAVAYCKRSPVKFYWRGCGVAEPVSLPAPLHIVKVLPE